MGMKASRTWKNLLNDTPSPERFGKNYGTMIFGLRGLEKILKL
jgi:hypothetical protein